MKSNMAESVVIGINEDKLVFFNQSSIVVIEFCIFYFSCEVSIFMLIAHKLCRQFFTPLARVR